MRRRSGQPSLRGAQIAVGDCASIVFRVAAAEMRREHHEADRVIHFRLAIRISEEKMWCSRIFRMQKTRTKCNKTDFW
jgi:hypothetical protein